jgi:hypothetical protein
MLERDMEAAVASCPDLFIEPHLTLLRRQVVINGRRPDVLFSDNFSRHLLVEIQSGRLDEDHLQRHFYYFYDYRQKYPSTSTRLMFIANRIVPQHKQFLDEHGYEFREYPENDFERRVAECNQIRGIPRQSVEVVDTPGVLTPEIHEILYDIENHRMTLSYKMLLLMYMAELAEGEGRVSLRQIAEKFQSFFVDRAARNKQEENPKVVRPGTLSSRTLSSWERTIREQPVHYLTELFVIEEAGALRWAPRIWQQWNPTLKRAIRDATFDRLVRYFERNVPGGY